MVINSGIASDEGSGRGCQHRLGDENAKLNSLQDGGDAKTERSVSRAVESRFVNANTHPDVKRQHVKKNNDETSQGMGKQKRKLSPHSLDCQVRLVECKVCGWDEDKGPVGCGTFSGGGKERQRSRSKTR
ncbi:hypothetical protein RUM44_010141 [Polyplax serrata]|uniref:Uncharacterized protein n=1 Tax=Polyplax serrata TaxID=468196 RepID=A0ABR1AWG9_POLSC